MANFLHENKEEKNWVLHCFCLLLRVRWYADIHTCIIYAYVATYGYVIHVHMYVHTCIKCIYILFSFVE